MLLHHIGGILDRITRLLVGACLLEDMRRQNIPDIVRTVRQQALDGAATGIGIVDSISLDDGSPSLVECRGVVCGFGTGRLHRLHEQGAGVLCTGEQHTAVPFDVRVQVFVKVEQVGQDQAERFLAEEGRAGILEGDGRDEHFPATLAIAPAQLPAFHVFQPAFRRWKMTARADAKLAEVLLPQP